MNLSPTLALMKHAAEQAGDSLLQDFSSRERLIVEQKKPGDFVSQADRKAEKIIVDILRAAHPGWGILGEEGTNEAAGPDGHRWIIDPLDGTTNFLNGVPNWCVTIGLEHQGEIIAGVTWDVLRNELFYAEKGQGAFLNGHRLSVSRAENLIDGIGGIDGALSSEEDMQYLAGIWHKTYAELASTVVLCSAALTMAYTAAGRFAVCHVAGVQPWDIAAGILLIREAGGVVTDRRLQPVDHLKGEAVAGSSGLYKKYVVMLGLGDVV